MRYARGPAAAGPQLRLLSLLCTAATLGTPIGVFADETATAPLLRVRTVVAQTVATAATQALTGDIQPRYLSALSFRTNGKIATRTADVGRHVTPDEVVATLDPADQLADIQNARATLASTQAGLAQAAPEFTRKRALLASGDTTLILYNNAEQALRSAVAAMESAKAAYGAAEEQLGFTALRSGVAGVLTERDAEVGQVVQAGQTVFTLAQDGPRDAVFNVYETLLAKPFENKTVDVALQADPAVHVAGEVREIAPAVDAGSGTVKVKVGLAATPPGMSLGAIVVGTGHYKLQSGISLPWSALFQSDGRPALWVVDPQTARVSLRTVSVGRYADDTMIISDGIAPGERLVTAGTQFLRPGQVVQPVDEPRP